MTARTSLIKKLSASISDLLSLQRKTADNSGTTSLHHATQMANLTLVKALLLNADQNVDVEDAQGRTSLHYAVSLNSTDVASALLANGANPDSIDLNGSSPMHNACRDGMIDAVNLLLYYRADQFAIDNLGRMPFDIACEYGRFKTVQLLLENDAFNRYVTCAIRRRQSSTCQRGGRTIASALHLAARQGHLSVLVLLLQAGWPLDYVQPSGSVLHEAVVNGRLEVVRFLLYIGADSTLLDDHKKSAESIATRNVHKNPISGREILYLLRECKSFVYGRAVLEFSGVDADELTFNIDDIIWIIERDDSKAAATSSSTRRWKGIIFGEKYHSRSGYFPPSAVEIVDKSSVIFPTKMSRSAVGHHQRQAKKISVPIVPDIICNRAQSMIGMNRHCIGGRVSSAQLACNGNASSTNAISIVDSSNVNGNVSSSMSNRLMHQQHPVVDSSAYRLTNIVSPRHRNSTGSNSSQASSGFESMKSCSTTPASSIATTTTATNHTLRDDSSPPSRNSVHSSSSGGSIGSGASLDRLDTTSGSMLYTPAVTSINIYELMCKGVADAEVLATWLHELHYDEYLSLFLAQGYDLLTIARMTPEDLTAIGITKPGHRKRLTMEIHRWQIADQWPTVCPPGGLREWLRAIGLSEYYPLLESQGYTQMVDVMQLTWEDLEDIGIKRLGHLKKFGLAIRKLKDGRNNYNNTNGSASCQSSGQLTMINVQQHPTGIRSTAQVKPYCHQPPPSGSTLNTFQQQQQSSNYCCNDTDSYLTYPRRTNHHQQHVIEVQVHDRPTVQVRPVLAPVSSKLSTSHEAISCCQSSSPSPPPPSCYSDQQEMLMKKRYMAPLPAVNATSSTYSNEFDLIEQPKSVRLNLYSPGRILSDGGAMPTNNRNNTCTLRQQSSWTTTGVDTSIDDDYPPPPAPIACEGPIRRLRSVISTNGGQCSDRSVDHNQLSSSSRSSTSSTEALPFANENCGTMKSRNGNNNNGSSSVSQPCTPRQSARHAFVQSDRNSINGHMNGDVLSDIGSMLQNLTDELDEMLHPSSQKLSIERRGITDCVSNNR